MEKDYKKELEKIVGGIACPKNFRCYKSEFRNLCKAKLIEGESLIVCLEENPPECIFSYSYAIRYYCQCPLRDYIARKLGK